MAQIIDFQAQRNKRDGDALARLVWFLISVRRR